MMQAFFASRGGVKSPPCWTTFKIPLREKKKKGRRGKSKKGAVEDRHPVTHKKEKRGK